MGLNHLSRWARDGQEEDRADCGEDQALQLVRFEGFDLPLQRPCGIEAVAAGEARAAAEHGTGRRPAS